MLISMMAAMVLAASPSSLPTASPPGALVSLEFDGSLKDGLKQLAQKSGLNLVVIGDFNEHVNLNLPSVNGEEALETIAQAYGLEVTRSGKAADGKMWVIRRAAAAPVAVIPVVTPTPSADAIREAADRAREQAEELRAKTESVKDVTQDAREQAREAAQTAREQAQEAAEAAREQAQEAAEAAREQAQEAAEAERDRLEALRDQGQAQADLNRAQIELERHRVSTGGPVTVDKGSHVDTAVAYGGPVIVEEDAVVDGDAVAFGGDVILKKGAVVEGDAVSFGGSVVRAEGSSVHGESVSMGGSGIGTAVARNVVKTQRSARVSEAQDADDSRGGFGRGLAVFLLQFSLLFGLGFVAMMFAPQRMKALESTLRAEPLKNGFAGLLAGLALFPLTVMLIVTVVGIPVAMVMWAALPLVLAVGAAAVANMVGAKIPTGKLRKTQALVLAVGLLAMLLVWQVPGMRWVELMLVMALSLGAIIRTRFGQNSRGTPMLDPMHQAAPSL
jgi:hypothetical protein